jgi:hypothetical protein
MRFLTAFGFVAATLVSSNATAQLMEYVRVCDEFGANFFYSPGTATCVNAMTGETVKITEKGEVRSETEVAKQAKDANEGVALSLALPNAVVDAGKTFGAAANVGVFNGESAIGISGAISPADGLSLTGAFGMGLSRGTAGGRAGINYSW